MQRGAGMGEGTPEVERRSHSTFRYLEHRPIGMVESFLSISPLMSVSSSPARRPPGARPSQPTAATRPAASTRRVALVTGASSGIGAATALRLARDGHVVYGAARRVEQMDGLVAAGGHALRLDVTDEDSLQSAVQTVLDAQGRIDLLVNSAAYGSYGAVEDVPLAEGERQFDVNVFGAVRLIQLVTPIMRRQKSGRIVNVSSVGGEIHTPFGAWYHGSKFALEGMSNVLRIELAPFGIDVVVVQPGATKSEWSQIAAEHLRSTSGQGPYAAAATNHAKAMTTGSLHDNASDPSVIAKTIGASVTARRPRTRYVTGYYARPVLTLRRLLPERSFDRIVSRSMG